MKLRLLILLAAAALAAPAAGQTIKSLGYNTTNGQIVYSGTNALTFTNALQFSTNARAATRTNLGGTTLGNAVFTATNTAAAQVAIFGTNAEINTSGGLVGLTLSTNETKLLNPISFPFLGGATAAATSRTNLGLGATNEPTFSNIQLGIFGAGSDTGFVGRNSGGLFALYGTNVSTSVPAFYGWSGIANTAFSAGTARTNLELGATNSVTFSNVTASGTLTATGNATLNGVGNTAPSQTADSASSLMTRDLLFRAQADDNSGDLVAMVGNTTNGGTGALASVVNVFGGNAQVSTNSNSVAGVYFADNIWANSTVSGAVMPSGKTIDLTMKGLSFRNLTNTNYVIRVVAGVGTPLRTIPAAGQDALSAKGWGVNVFYNGTNHVFQPFWYTTNYNTGPQTVVSNATANDSIFAVRLRHVGPTTNGTISFWINDGLASRLSATPSFSTNVGDWGGNFVGRHYAIESATATNAAPTSTTGIRVRAAYIKYEP